MKKIFSIMLSLVLCFSLCAVAFASDNSEKSYVVLGDSIAQGFGVYNRDKASYGRIVADTIGYSYANFGVNGLRSWDLIELLSEDEVNKSVARADLISLSIGGNDYLQQDLPKIAFRLMQGDEKILNDIEANYIEYFARIIEIIRSLNPDAVLLVQTLYNPMTGPLGSFYGLAVMRVNRDIEAYLSEHSGTFEIVDTRPVMEGRRECVAVDTIHPSAVGNVELARAVLSKLVELGLSETDVPQINVIGIDELPFSSYVLRWIFKLFGMR